MKNGEWHYDVLQLHEPSSLLVPHCYGNGQHFNGLDKTSFPDVAQEETVIFNVNRTCNITLLKADPLLPATLHWYIDRHQRCLYLQYEAT